MKLTARTTGIEEARAELLRIGAMPAKALAQVADETEEFVAQEAGKHSKTGAIVSSVYLRREGADFVVGHDGQRAPEALFVHWGTRAHVIRPKRTEKQAQAVKAHTRIVNGKSVHVSAHTRMAWPFLRWARGGKFYRAREVNHPGYRGDPWMVRAATMAPRLFEQHLQTMIDRQGA